MAGREAAPTSAEGASRVEGGNERLAAGRPASGMFPGCRPAEPLQGRGTAKRPASPRGSRNGEPAAAAGGGRPQPASRAGCRGAGGRPAGGRADPGGAARAAERVHPRSPFQPVLNHHWATIRTPGRRPGGPGDRREHAWPPHRVKSSFLRFWVDLDTTKCGGLGAIELAAVPPSVC